MTRPNLTDSPEVLAYLFSGKEIEEDDEDLDKPSEPRVDIYFVVMVVILVGTLLGTVTYFASKMLTSADISEIWKSQFT